MSQTPITTSTGVAIVRLAKVDPASEEDYEKRGDGIQKLGYWKIQKEPEFLKAWLRMFVIDRTLI